MSTSQVTSDAICFFKFFSFIIFIPVYCITICLVSRNGDFFDSFRSLIPILQLVINFHFFFLTASTFPGCLFFLQLCSEWVQWSYNWLHPSTLSRVIILTRITDYKCSTPDVLYQHDRKELCHRTSAPTSYHSRHILAQQTSSNFFNVPYYCMPVCLFSHRYKNILCSLLV